MDHEEGVVSLWVGRGDSKDALIQYMHIAFTGDGDSIPSQFQKDFDISHVDEDFLEKNYRNQPASTLHELLAGHSFAEIFTSLSNAFMEKCSHRIDNCTVILYDYRYDESVAETDSGLVTLRFVGTVSYK